MNSGEIALFTLIGAIINGFVIAYFTRRTSQEIEQLKINLTEKKDRSFYKFTKHIDLQIGTFSEIGKLENIVNQKLFAFTNSWEEYLEEDLKNKKSLKITRQAQDHASILESYKELVNEFASKKYFLSDNLENLYSDMFNKYENILNIIDEAKSRTYNESKFTNLPFSSEEREYLHQFWYNLTYLISADLKELKIKIKAEIHHFIES